jgi:hypothetical protein
MSCSGSLRSNALWHAAGMNWRKSSYSFSNGNCTEVAADGHAVGVRDSTDPDGPVLTFDGSTWGRFVAALKKA